MLQHQIDSNGYFNLNLAGGGGLQGGLDIKPGAMGVFEKELPNLLTVEIGGEPVKLDETTKTFTTSIPDNDSTIRIKIQDMVIGEYTIDPNSHEINKTDTDFRPLAVSEIRELAHSGTIVNQNTDRSIDLPRFC